MDRELVLKTIEVGLRSILKNDNLVITGKEGGGDLKGWDSLSHVELIDFVERNYSIKISSLDMMRFNDLNGLVDIILSKGFK